MTPTQWKQPKTGEMKLRVKYRNGWVSKWEFVANQLRWTDTGDDWDVIEVERA